MTRFPILMTREQAMACAKVFALGAVCLCGCVLWGPLLLRASAPREAAIVQGQPASTISQSPVLRAPHWQKLDVALGSDPLFRRGGSATSLRNPFWTDEEHASLDVLVEQPASHTTPPEVGEANISGDVRPEDAPISSPVPPAAVPAVTPTPFVASVAGSPALALVSESLVANGLDLSSTMIGATRQVAIINGRTSSVGDELNVQGRSYRLVSIESQQVILSSDGQPFVLKMPRSHRR
jgi:hypothetical protein